MELSTMRAPTRQAVTRDLMNGTRAQPTDQAARRRDEFTGLVHAHDRSIRMLAYRLLGDGDLVDDALQEAYLRAYRALPSFRDEAAASTWLYRITYNVCLDRLRAGKRAAQGLGVVRSLEHLAEEGAEPATDLDLADVVAKHGDLEAALATLPVDQRAAVMLVDAIGYDYWTAANILGVKEGTVASRLSTARAQLRGALSPQRRGDLR